MSQAVTTDGLIDTAAHKIYVYRYMPFVVLYVFFNSAWLPVGLTYCTMLSPLFWLWLYSKGERWILGKFVVCLLPFVAAHVLDGIDSPVYYLRTTLLLWSAYVTAYAFCIALLEYKKVSRLFQHLIVLNACAVCIALILYATPFRESVWSVDTLAQRARGETIYRLRWLATEPSAYAALMLPLILFATLRVLRRADARNLMYLGLIAIPLLLSQSFGGLSMYVAGVATAVVATHKKILLQLRSLIVLAAIAICIACLIYIPSPISTRISQVFTGSDSSVDSRTVSAFIVAQIVVSHKSMWWGVGLGQAKLVDLPAVGLAFHKAVIPNAVADLYAEMGIVGVMLKIGFEVYLLFLTRAYRNSFRLAMFVVAFISQLTGGYIEDVQEYMMWCFAFCPFLPEFDLDTRVKTPDAPNGMLAERHV